MDKERVVLSQNEQAVIAVVAVIVQQFERTC
jgi:hypothetical protein